ncbi:chaperone modulator CbpM [Alloalcanivorax mobilis]|uniref:chaperone modulator CbpM n=1 Tax=Alloalcanivorax mobilis TaxID=2019569 RepID=UPI000B5B23FB|nr:chaperone modulator CbpM [Alloalcanivorax mobilis]ASK33977.1 chaperone modulatory protein CbpM [Alcanivorax sp. N3-2A]|tara:strand:- start:28665 stop:28961 length:297 start_codon:yes stop_codon:yes gene_type:complete
MSSWQNGTLTLSELCHRVALPRTTVVEIVEVGIIEPVRHGNDWHFDEQVVLLVTRACRLHQDLGIDWNGVALALELLEEVASLRQENQRLRQRLQRFS